MIRRKKRTLPELKTRSFAVDILGGEEDYEEDIYAFIHAEQGIKPFYELESRRIMMSAANLVDLTYNEEYGNIFFLLNSGIVVYGLIEAGKISKIFTMETESDYTNFFNVSIHSKELGRIELFVCGRKVAYLSGGLSGTVTQTEIPYNIRSGTVHCGRLFAVDIDKPYRLCWSGTDVLDWSDSVEGYGYIDLEMNGGDIIQIVEFDDDLICLRDRGITVVHALADSRNYRISPSQKLIGGIMVTGKGAVYNGKFLFPCKDGVYSYDGSQITKEFFIPLLSDYVYKRVYADNYGFAYVECNNGETDLILVYEIATKRWGTFGYGSKYPLWSKGKFYFYDTIRGLIGNTSLNYVNTQSYWKSKTVRPGTKPVKTLKSLYIDASADVTIDVIVDSVTYTFTGKGEITTGLRGKEFKFEIVKTRAEIRKVTGNFEEVL